MAKTTRPRRDPWADAVRHLGGLGAEWADLVGRVGPCPIRPRKDRFGTLVRAVIGQQISSRAAATIDARLKALAGDPHTPDGVLGAGEAGLRSVGLSGVKSRYVLNLASAVQSGEVPLAKIHRRDDDAVVACLTQVSGIGVWTAQMFLIFALNRPDVLPVGDLGVRAAMRDHFGLDDLPRPQLCQTLAEPWRPFRSIACWYLWRSLEPAHRRPPTATAPDASPAQAKKPGEP